MIERLISHGFSRRPEGLPTLLFFRDCGPNNSGSLAKFAAIRRASSLVSTWSRASSVLSQLGDIRRDPPCLCRVNAGRQDLHITFAYFRRF